MYDQVQHTAHMCMYTHVPTCVYIASNHKLMALNSGEITPVYHIKLADTAQLPAYATRSQQAVNCSSSLVRTWEAIISVHVSFRLRYVSYMCILILQSRWASFCIFILIECVVTVTVVWSDVYALHCMHCTQRWSWKWQKKNHCYYKNMVDTCTHVLVHDKTIIISFSCRIFFVMVFLLSFFFLLPLLTVYGWIGCVCVHLRTCVYVIDSLSHVNSANAFADCIKPPKAESTTVNHIGQ